MLKSELPSRFQVISGMKSTAFAEDTPAPPDSLLVKGSWLARANVRVLRNAGGADIEIVPGASYPGLVRLGDRLGAARNVHDVPKDNDRLSQGSS